MPGPAVTLTFEAFVWPPPALMIRGTVPPPVAFTVAKALAIASSLFTSRFLIVPVRPPPPTMSAPSTELLTMWRLLTELRSMRVIA